MRSLHQVAQIKQVLPLEAQRIRILNKRINREPHNLHLAEATLRLENHHRRAQQELIKVYAKAESEAGKPWTKRLETLTTEQAKYGAKGKVLVTRLNQQRDALKELAEEGAKVPLVYKALREEAAATAEQLGAFTANTEGIGPKRLHPQGPEGKHHPMPQRVHPGNHKSTGSAQSRGLSFAKPRALHINAAPVAQSGPARDITVTIPVNLDGREVARSTAKVAKDEALLQ